MNRLLISVVLSFVTLAVTAQVSYGDLSFGSYNMKINLITENDSIFLYVIYSDEKRTLSDNPKLLLRLMDDTVLSLEGKNLGSHNKSDGGVVISNIYIASNHTVSEAKFPVSAEQIMQFKKGIKKLRLNTSPKYHEREWRKDKIGKKLFNAYIKNSPNSFEDGF